MSQEVFSSDEKIIIERLRNAKFGPEFLANIIDSDIQNARIRVDKKDKKAYVLVQKPLLVDKEFEAYFIDRTFIWINYVIDISFVLLDALVKHGLAKPRSRADVVDKVVTFGPGAFNMPFEIREITDRNRVEALLRFVDLRLEILDRIEPFLGQGATQ